MTELAALAFHHHARHSFLIVLVVIVVLVVAILLWQRHRDRRAGTGEAHRRADASPVAPPPAPQGPPSPGPGAPPPPAPGAPLPPGTPVPVTVPRAPPASVVPRPRPTGDALVIEARDLTKRYGEKVAVDGLSFTVVPGHVTGFLGPNGAGKSTTMRMIMGLDRPDDGTVAVSGQPYHGLAWPLHEVGALLEANAIHPGRSAYAHLWMLARTNHISRVRVDEVLDLVGLTPVAGQRAGQFSLGMTQRLGIAAALLGDPGVLMFDEPVNGLDTDGIRWVRQLLRSLAAEGRTVFVSSHLMSEMALMADHVVVIGKGRLIADMSMEDFTSRHSHRSVRVRSPHLARLVPLLQSAGAEVTPEPDGAVTVVGRTAEEIGEVAWRESILLQELAPQSASLEQAFIESTEGDVEYRGGLMAEDAANGAAP